MTRQICLRTQDYQGVTCIQRMAGGWCGAEDLCQECTCRFMGAVEHLGESLSWSRGFIERAAGVS